MKNALVIVPFLVGLSACASGPMATAAKKKFDAAAFQEQVMGSLTPGKYADFVILDQDIMRVPENQILGTGVVATFIGGKVVYQRP